jgi:TIR domain
MKVFISWSKDESEVVGQAFASWLPTVIQECRDPFISTETTKGNEWFSTIIGALDTARVGIVFITPQNKDQPWLNFEAGALITKLESKRLCPVLVGLSKSNYQGPMTNYQMTEFDSRDDMLKLMTAINNACDNPLPSAMLETSFSTHWQDLQETTESARAALASRSAGAAERSTESKIDEILELARKGQISHPLLTSTERNRRNLESVTASGLRKYKGMEKADEETLQKLEALGGTFAWEKGPGGRLMGTAVGLEGDFDQYVVIRRDNTNAIGIMPLDSVELTSVPF